LREVEARNLTDYLARAIETTAQRDHRHSLNLAAKQHHGRLLAEFEKSSEYHDVARELASGVTSRNPKFTDKEKINLEIYAERQTDSQERERFLDLARDRAGTAREREGTFFSQSLNINSASKIFGTVLLKLLYSAQALFSAEPFGRAA
jgi:hypothetical protein